MAIIAGNQICIPVGSSKAEAVITNMKKLLLDRHHYKLSRKQFLKAWRGLRMALFMTGDYQRLRQRIAERCRGVCEVCHTQPQVHVHHVKPIAWHPNGALLDDNCMGVCRKCHRAAHRA